MHGLKGKPSICLNLLNSLVSLFIAVQRTFVRTYHLSPKVDKKIMKWIRYV